jgi:hypothetical protein
VQLVIPKPSTLIFPAGDFARRHIEQPSRLILRDGEKILFDHPYPFSSKERMEPLVVESPAATGEHNLTLSLVGDSGSLNTQTLYTESVTLTPGQVWIIMYDPSPKLK